MKYKLHSGIFLMLIVCLYGIWYINTFPMDYYLQYGIGLGMFIGAGLASLEIYFLDKTTINRRNSNE